MFFFGFCFLVIFFERMWDAGTGFRVEVVALMFPGGSVRWWLKFGALFFLLEFLLVLFSATMVEGRPVSDLMVRSFCLAEEFRAGWEGWLEGARLAQLKFGVEDAVCGGVLCAERTGFLVLAEEGDFPCTGPCIAMVG